MAETTHLDLKPRPRRREPARYPDRAGPHDARQDRVARPEQFFRPLRVFAFDPSFGSGSRNVMTITLPYEPLQPGPVGQRVAVVDYDGARDRLYPPVDLEDPRILLEGGLQPCESDPRFHQQMVYAVVSHTLRTFDRALGREVRFGFQRGRRRAARDSTRLRVYPHGVNEANAYYSADLRALVFGWFAAEEEEAGRNIPGQPVFTCLSHDIIVHETSHAVVDGMRQYFLEPSNCDTLAFHEAFADLVALFQHFTFAEPLLETVQRTGGRLHRAELAPEVEPGRGGAPAAPPAGGGIARERNPLVDLALQFGEALGTRRALRSAIGLPPDRKALAGAMEPHDRGAILVAAVFDAFFRVYARRTRDLFRLAGIGPGHRGELHPDLAERLCAEATSLADQFVQLCIRAVEFCPPVDMTFGDFLRALLTVHARVDPEDADGWREALIRGFVDRGIYPADVRSLTESDLVWKPPPVALTAPADLMDLLRSAERHDRDERARSAVLLHGFCDANREPLGLHAEAAIAVRTFHNAVRLLGAELEHAQDIVCEVTQTLNVPESRESDEPVKVRGGATLVLRGDGRVRYVISKELDAARAEAQLDFVAGLDRSGAGAYVAGRHGVDLRALHRGF